MKKVIAALLLLPSLCFGAAYDFGMSQRSAANNSWEMRLLASPSSTGIMAYDPGTKLASWLTLGQGLSVTNGVLSSGTGASVTWDIVTGKPAFSAVAVSGAYADLTGKPAIFSGAYADLSGKPAIPAPQVASDWNASTGVSAILNKPSLFSGAYADLTGKPSLFSGAYADLTGLPSLFSGAYADLTGKPTLFSGSYTDLSNKPSIPAAQVPSDWTATAGVAAILNKPSLFSGAYADLTGKPTLFSGSYTDLTNRPSIPSAQVQTDWNATTGLGVLLNKPTLFSGAYADLTGKPNIPPGQVQADWASTSGLTSILNKPTLFSGVYADLTGKPSIPAAQVNADWNSSSGLSQVLNKPSSFPPSAHTQSFSTITNTPTTLAGYGITDAISAPVPSSISRTLNSAYQINASRPVFVSYAVDISVVSLLLTGTQGTVTLQYGDTSSMSNPVTVMSATNSTAGVMNVANIGTATLVGFIPAGKYVRIVTANTTGSPTFTFRNGQETIF